MEAAVRETFWNVPLWAAVFVYAGGALACALFAWGVWRRVAVWRGGGPDRRWGEARARLRRLLAEGLFQTRILRQPYPGLMHASILWGFLALLAGTAIATVDWEITRLLFDWRLLKGPFYLGFELVLDVFGLVLLAGLALAAWRRFVLRPSRVEPAAKFAYALGVLAVLAISGYLIEGARLAVTRPAWGPWSPVGWAVADAYAALGLGEPALRRLHLALWLFHAVVVFAFIALIPWTYFAHVVATPLNILLQKRAPRGALPKIEALEAQERFGVSTFEQFSWKRRLDFDACTECGRCQDVCCAQVAGAPLSPKRLIGKLRRHMHAGATGPLHGTVVGADELWACTTCMACVEVCPARIDIVDTIVDLRRHLAMEEGAFPPGVGSTLQHTGGLGNPWGLDPAGRTRWADGLPVRWLAPGEQVEVLYWIGCAAAYDPRAQKIARAMVRILEAAGVAWGALRDERCHGEFGRRLGEEYLYQTAAAENIANLRQLRFDRVLTHCPHCLNTFRNEYRQFDGGALEVVHHAALIAELAGAGRLPLAGEASTRAVVFHDPCYLGRHNGEYDAPRAALAAVPGLRLVEAAQHRSDALCCGGGGGQMWMEQHTRKKVNVVRAGDLAATGAGTLAVGCPHCMTMLDDARKTLGAEASLALRDIAEIVADALPPAGARVA